MTSEEVQEILHTTETTGQNNILEAAEPLAVWLLAAINDLDDTNAIHHAIVLLLHGIVAWGRDSSEAEIARLS